MARPIVHKLDESLIEKLASIHCTLEEIASICDCSTATLKRRYAPLIKEAKAKGRSSLRRYQWEHAQKGNPALLIWLGKQLLGQKDTSRIEITQIPAEIFDQEVARRMKLVSGE
jgi:hypothetical protein